MSADENLHAGQAGPLPMGPDVFYRVHHQDAPFGPEHAASGLVDHAGRPVKGERSRRGYSTFQNPHELEHYLDEMGWTGRADFGERRVIAFRGRQVGRGANHEPLAIPHSAEPDESMTWDTFQQRLAHTDMPHLRLAPGGGQ